MSAPNETLGQTAGPVPKVGRNDPCPCGAPKKYKKCHGRSGGPARSASTGEPASPVSNIKEVAAFDMRRLKSSDPCPCSKGRTFGDCHEPGLRSAQKTGKKIEADRREHEALFGEVRQPVHINFQGYKFVGVGSEIHWAKESEVRTFPDFLIRFLKLKLGRVWWEAEVRKPLAEQHPITQWYTALYEGRRRTGPNPGGTVTIVPDGPTAAFMLLAYDLFILQDNKALEKRVLERLKHPDQFQGARHELFATATCIRAGFDITLERETDGSRKHPEFTAIHRHTGQRIALEAKSRRRPGVLGFHPEWPKDESPKAGMRDLILSAFEKAVDVPLVVFAEVNYPPSRLILSEPPWFREVIETVTTEFTADCEAPEPFNLLVFSNHPYHYGEAGGSCPPRSVLNFVAPRPRHPATDPEAILRIADEAEKWGRVPNEFPVDPRNNRS